MILERNKERTFQRIILEKKNILKNDLRKEEHSTKERKKERKKERTF